MRVFITGASGGLGSLLVEQLARVPEVECITGIDVAERKKPLPANVQFVKMDIRSPDLVRVMAGHDTVIHTAFIVMWLAKMPAAVRKDINVNGAGNVARAALINRARRLVHASSTGAYDIPLLVGKSDVTEDFPIGKGILGSYYCNDKAAAEQALTEILGDSDILLTLLRPCAIVGPRSTGSVQALRDTAAKLPGRDPRVQIAHEDDVAAAFVRAATHDMPGAYNVAPDDFIRMSQVWKMAGTRVPVIPSHLLQLLVAMRWRYLGSPIHPSWVGAYLADYTASNAKLKADGWKPRYGSADALRAAL